MSPIFSELRHYPLHLDQYNGVIKVLKEYNLESKIGLFCFDTTSSNTGIHKGSLIRISTELNKYLILLACRHHVSELRITHFCEGITNEKTTAPDNPLFKHFKNLFEQPNFEYNPSMLVKFGWEEIKGTVVEKAATESLEYCRSYLLRNNIVREDRKELGELVVSYLSPSIIKIRKTGVVHHARFLRKSICYLKMQMLSTQIDFIQKNREHIKVITEFIACFYAKWYLQSNDTIKAPFMDVTAIHQMHQCKAVCAKPFAVDAVLNSLFKHTWYLDSTLIPLALLDDGVALEEKKKIAAAILSFPKPKSCYFKTENKQKKDIEKLLKIELNIHQQIPSLASLVDEFCWLMFDMFGIKDQRIDD